MVPLIAPEAASPRLRRDSAKRFLRVHDLRAADALQLAAESRPSTLAFVCLDARLLDAAQREGFATTPVTGAES